jgi:hypothetical protein
MNPIEKGPIFVSGAYGDKGCAIVKTLLETLELLHLDTQSVYASVIDGDSLSAQEMSSSGAITLSLNVFENYADIVDTLKKVVKLILVIDPLNKRITRDNLFQYGKM